MIDFDNCSATCAEANGASACEREILETVQNVVGLAVRVNAVQAVVLLRGHSDLREVILVVLVEGQPVTKSSVVDSHDGS